MRRGACPLAGRSSHAPCNCAASAKTVDDLGPTSWRPRAGLGSPRNASMSPARDAPRGAEKRSQPCRLAGRSAYAPCNRAACANTVYDLGPTAWRPRVGLGRSSKKCEHVAGARRAEPTMQTCKPQCAKALQPRGKCENGLRSGSGRALASADRPINASISPARDAPRGTEQRRQPCTLAGRRAHAPCNRTASAKTVYDLGPTSWRPRAGLGRSSKIFERVAGARRAEPTMETCRPQCPRALQPHGNCKKRFYGQHLI